MPPVIRLARGQDAQSIQRIYAPVVRDTVISFELEIPSVLEMKHRIVSTLETLPWIVCENEGDVLGYAYAGEHSDRAAYQWSADVSVYIAAEARRTGVGRAVYRSLLNLLVVQGFWNAYAGITLPNPASVGLHESFEFQPVGVYRTVGYKFGGWHDVGWWHLPLQQHDGPPEPPALLPDAVGSLEWNRALESGLPLLRIGP